MSNWPSGHPDEELLLRSLDGELPARKSRQVRKHLQACWQCRAELESLEATVAECVRYRKQVLAGLLPEAPNAWQKLDRGFDRVDAELAAAPFWKRVPRLAPAWQWGVAAAAAAALLIAAIVQFGQAPSVQAASLLRKAVAAASAHQTRVRHISIRMRSGLSTRHTVGGAAGTLLPLPPDIHMAFEAAHYDDADPLSARAFQAWRDSLPRKTDDVSTEPAAEDPHEPCYRIRTQAAEGGLASATLLLRVADLTPVESKFEFRDQNWIEFTQVMEPPLQPDGSPVATPYEAPLRPVVPSRPAALAPRPSASISDELQVLAQLHRIGADLGDPVEVNLTDGKVLVSGVGVSPERQRQIHDLLDNNAGVEVRFSEPQAAQVTPPAEAAPVTAGDTANIGIQTRLEKQLGGRAEFERFSTRVLDGDDAAMAHAYALRSVAERFPAAAEKSMTAADRAQLHELAREHVAALGTQVRVMEGALAPVLAGLGGKATAAPLAPGAETAWQQAADDSFRASRRLEVLLSVLLGVTPGQNATADLPSQVLAAFADLKAGLGRCQTLLAQ
ncbi:MAG: hypothetical protein WCB12_05920 [Bryobacteraceae bacterium]